MKVAYLLNQHPYASCTFIRREIAGLEAAGFEVMRISIRPPELEIVDAADECERAQTRIVLEDRLLGLIFAAFAVMFSRPVRFADALRACIRLGWRSRRGIAPHLAYLAEACSVLRWLEDEGVEHVHAHFGTNASSVAMLCRMIGGPPYSFTVHGPGEFDEPYALYLGEKVRRAAFVVTISSYASAQLFRWCEVDQWPKVHIVHCGVDDLFLQQGPTPVPEAPQLVSVGRFTEQKGYPILIEAAARLAKEGLAFSLVLIGDGELRADLERMIEEHVLQGHVALLGWKSDAEVHRQILSSRAMVLPSFAEGLPVVIMEALAMSRPVIATSIAGIPELVEHGRCGWLVPAGSVEAITEAMREALSATPDELGTMGRLGRERVLANHDAGIEARKIGLLIRESATGRT